MARSRLAAVVGVIVFAVATTPSAATPGKVADGGGPLESAAVSYVDVPITRPTSELFERFAFQVALPSVPDTLVPLVLQQACGGGGVQSDRVLWYGPGSAPDFAWDFWGFTGVSPGVGEKLSVDVTPLSIIGNYQPLAGDFDSDGCTDVLWYAPGTAKDYIWWSADPRLSAPLSITGSYRPMLCPRAFGQLQPIIWYAPGPGTDSMWWASELTRSFHKANLPTQVNGDYRAFCTAFGTIFWYGVGTRADYFWTTNFPNAASHPATLDDPDLRPLTRTAELYFDGSLLSLEVGLLYSPGAARDILLYGYPDGYLVVPQPDGFNLTGSYRRASIGNNLAVLATAGPAPELVRIRNQYQYFTG